MKYAVDRVENNIAILENINTNDIIEISIEKLPNNIKEGNILKYHNDKYIIDSNEEEKIKTRIKEKLERLKSLKKGDNHG